MANYIFLKKTLEENIFKLKKAFVDRELNFQIFYSVKTNSSNEVLNVINKYCKFEIVSSYEWELIEKYSPTEIVLNGPSKNLTILEKIYKSDVQKIYFNIDNDTDLELLSHCHQKFKDKLIIGIRVYCNKTGMWNRFGYDIDSERFKKILSEFKYINGLHFHFSTNNFDISNYDLMLAKINHLIKNYNLDIKYIDIGGGLPGASEIIYNNKVFNDLPELFKNKINKDILIISEVGRHLVENTFNINSSIISIKRQSDDKYDVTIDTNILHFPCFWEKKFSIDYQSSKVQKGKPTTVNIFGNSCMQIDKIASNYLLPHTPEVGDKITINNVGAYSLSQASNFITPIPSIIIN